MVNFLLQELVGLLHGVILGLLEVGLELVCLQAIVLSSVGCIRPLLCLLGQTLHTS